MTFGRFNRALEFQGYNAVFDHDERRRPGTIVAHAGWSRVGGAGRVGAEAPNARRLTAGFLDPRHTVCGGVRLSHDSFGVATLPGGSGRVLAGHGPAVVRLSPSGPLSGLNRRQRYALGT